VVEKVTSAVWQPPTNGSWAFIVAITASVGLELAPRPPVLVALLGLAGIVIAILLTRSWLRLRPALLMCRQLTKQSVAVTLSDGAELVGKLVVNLDVLPSVRASGQLWVTGTPTPGATLAVGVPDHPVAGLVRFGRQGGSRGWKTPD
jgi:hypothetical protein